jgi:hypothetical protein
MTLDCFVALCRAYQIDTLVDIIKVISLLKEIGLRTRLNTTAIALTGAYYFGWRVGSGAQQRTMNIALSFGIKLKPVAAAMAWTSMRVFVFFQKILDKVASRSDPSHQGRTCHHRGTDRRRTRRGIRGMTRSSLNGSGSPADRNSTSCCDWLSVTQQVQVGTRRVQDITAHNGFGTTTGSSLEGLTATDMAARRIHQARSSTRGRVAVRAVIQVTGVARIGAGHPCQGRRCGATARRAIAFSLSLTSVLAVVHLDENTSSSKKCWL